MMRRGRTTVLLRRWLVRIVVLPVRDLPRRGAIGLLGIWLRGGLSWIALRRATLIPLRGLALVALGRRLVGIGLLRLPLISLLLRRLRILLRRVLLRWLSLIALGRLAGRRILPLWGLSVLLLPRLILTRIVRLACLSGRWRLVSRIVAALRRRGAWLPVRRLLGIHFSCRGSGKLGADEAVDAKD